MFIYFNVPIILRSLILSSIIKEIHLLPINQKPGDEYSLESKLLIVGVGTILRNSAQSKALSKVLKLHRLLRTIIIKKVESINTEIFYKDLSDDDGIYERVL